MTLEGSGGGNGGKKKDRPPYLRLVSDPEKPLDIYEVLSGLVDSSDDEIKVKFAIISALKESKISKEQYNVLVESLLDKTIERKSELEVALKNAHIDSRTSLLRPDFYEPALDKLINESKRYEKKRHAKIGILVLMFDIDDFKTFNDTYGHLEGNKVLTIVGQRIKEIMHRNGDSAYRYGGEEISMILPLESDSDLSREQILSLAKAKQAALNDNLIIFIKIDDPESGGKKRVRVPILLSMGSAFFPEGGDGSVTAEILTKEADDELYKDKKLKKERLKSAQEKLGLSPF
jgi:diguanylate cyclase (GGDEF)-like protein